MDYKNLDRLDDYLNAELSEIIKSNDMKILHNMLVNENYLDLTQKRKEQLIFNNICIKFFVLGIGENVLKYIIFEYNINEDDALNCVSLSTKELLQPMFEARKLKDELKTELVVPDNNKKKNLKV